MEGKLRERGRKKGREGARREGMKKETRKEGWRENEGYFYKKSHESY